MAFGFLGKYSPGALWFRFRETFGDGLGTAYFRDIIRPRIQKHFPVSRCDDERCEIHVLTSASDWQNLLWVLHSLYAVVPERFRLCIHEDGTLSEEAATQLTLHFPGCRLIRRKEADKVAAKRLAKHPKCAHFRSFHPLALKVFDFHFFLKSDRMFILDSDILFFGHPSELIQRLLDPVHSANTLNLDWNYGYSLSEETIRKYLPEFPFIPHINSGLGLIHRGSIPLDWAEEILSCPDILERPHCVEQTIIALCSSRHGFTPLPDAYTVSLNPRKPGQPVKHYTSPIRPLFYREGVAELGKCLLAKQSHRSHPHQGRDRDNSKPS